MRLTELVEQLDGFEEVETDRPKSQDGIRVRHNKTIFYVPHKLVSEKTGATVYARAFEERDEPVNQIELLFPRNFESRYWETAQKIDAITGISLEEIKSSTVKDGMGEHWTHNYDFRNEVEKLYESLRTRVELLVNRSFKELEESGLNNSGVGYVNTSFLDPREGLKGGENLKLGVLPPTHQRRLGTEDKAEEYVQAVKILEGLAEATQDDWQKIENATVVYAQHLVELYKPVLPGE
jgi:hypothetical protein